MRRAAEERITAEAREDERERKREGPSSRCYEEGQISQVHSIENIFCNPVYFYSLRYVRFSSGTLLS